MDPIITVLMPVYNAEKYLREAIDSILAQTLTNFEFLIIDDGSSDSSISIIQSYNDPRIRLVQNDKNYGITYSLNKGIQLASAELIARMDADDISHPTRLEKQYKFAQNNPDFGIVSTWIRRISSDGKFKEIAGVDTKDIFYILLFSPRGIYHPTVIYRRSAVMDAGMYKKKYAEDFNLWCELVKTNKFYVIHEPLLDYRSSETSLWRVTKKKEYEEAHMEQIQKNVEFYTNNRCNLTEAELNFLRGRVIPIVHLHNKSLIIQAFQKLEFITDCFSSVNNINATNDSGIMKAAFNYKLYLINKLVKHLRKKEVLEIMIKLKYWSILLNYLKQETLSKFKKKWKSTS